MLARFARHTATPLPLLTGHTPTPAEWAAAQEASLEWSFQDALLVVLCERVDAVRYMVQKAFSQKGATVTEPLRIPRPDGEESEGPIRMKASDFAAMIAKGL